MKKRPPGTGHLYRRYKTWWMKVNTPSGRIQRSTGTHDRQEAERQLLKLLSEVAEGRRPKPRNVTMGDLLDDLKADYELNQRTSLPQLESRVKNHLQAVSNMKAHEFTSKHATAYQRRRKRQGASHAAINREMEHVRAALTRAVEDGILDRAPKIRMLTVDNVRTGFLETYEYRILRDSLPYYLKPLFVVAYHCGCRLGELLKLKWPQIDFAASQIWLEPRQTKDKTARVLPIYGDMERELRQAFRLRNEGDFPDCPWVFSHGGRRIVDFRKAWSTACKLAGVDITFHDLRRTAARNMDRAGVPREVIKRITGHKTDAMFSRYRIVDQRDVAEAGRAVGKWLEEQGDGVEKPKGVIQ